MFGLTSLGILHTAISLVALFSGILSLIRYKKISFSNQIGKIYVVTTVVTCVTGFGIFQHGGFGKPHALSIITLVVIGIAILAERKIKAFGRFSPYIEVVCYSMTFFFHWVPAITETATRVPLSAPLAASPDDPRIKTAVAVCLILFLIGATIQVIALRTKLKSTV